MAATIHASTGGAEKTDFQTLLVLVAVDDAGEHLDELAEYALAALSEEASGLALGPVATVDLDEQSVTIEMTVEASSASEASQKMGLILAALERGGPFVIQESKTSRSPSVDDDPQRELVCA